MLPAYDLDKIRFATNGPTFERAVEIYDSNGVKDFEDVDFGYSAKVWGSKGNFYKVFISAKHYDHGNCTCYLGQNDTLCKHMVAAAIYAAVGGRRLSAEEKQRVNEVVCSGRLGSLSKGELEAAKASIRTTMRYIKPYNGPSRNWFAYQDSLTEGCNRLAKIVSDLPASEQTAKLLVNLLLRLDKKLSIGGVDDSDGTVGRFIEETVAVLEEYAKLDPACIKAFDRLRGKETCFGWEEPLLELMKSRNLC